MDDDALPYDELEIFDEVDASTDSKSSIMTVSQSLKDKSWRS